MRIFCMLIFLIDNGRFVLCLSCKDIDNLSVDWFVLYKPPRSQSSSGTGFYYYDSNSPAKGLSFQLQDGNILNRKGNPLYFTIQEQKITNKFSYGIYNDQPPFQYPSPSNLVGHSKGMYAFAVYTGFWIISSIPRFPDLKYEYPEKQTVKGQICLCLSFGVDLWNKLGKLFHITNSNFYVGSRPNFYQEGADSYLDVESLTRKNQPLRIFAKSRTFNADLYSDIIADRFGDNLLVQTWQSQKICSVQIFDVGSMQFKDGYTFKATVDHSKWAVTQNLNWICIADLNRRKSQFGRGGLAVCLNHENLANEFRSIGNDIIHCDPNKEIPKGTCRFYG